ncbi:MAG: WG repeat-containing protein [Fulvivirga sp.]
MRILISFLLFFIVNISYSQIGASKRALKQLEKGDVDRSAGLIDKVLAKDSLFPAALFVKSRVLLDAQNKDPDIDSAYHFILLAQKRYDLLEEKERERHIRADIDSAAMQVQKQIIDSAAFHRASALNSEHSFNYFIDHFNTSSQLLLAITFRNALAYASALAENSYQSYEHFMEKYPKAVQVKEAKRRYEKLYFEISTKDGKVKSYFQFLSDHPDTPYRKEIETHIYEVMTADHSAKNYRSFIKKFPDSAIKSKAVAYLYHVLKEQGERLDNKFLSDSLKRVIELANRVILPFWENDRYGFVDAKGEVIIKAKYEKIEKSELCGGITRDYLLLENRIVGLNQATIYLGPYNEVIDLGQGLLKIGNSGKFGVVHKSGTKILPINNEAIKLISGKFLAFKQGGFWGLSTISGRNIAEARFTDILAEGPFIIFGEDELFDIKNEAVLVKAVDKSPLSFSMRFDDFEWISEEQLWLSTGEKEMIIDKNLKELIPLAPQQIKITETGFLIDKSGHFYLLDMHYKPIDKEPALSAELNRVWVALEGKDKWGLYDFETYTLRYEGLDSIKLMGSHFAMAYKNDSTAIITRDRPILLTTSQSASLIAEPGSEQYIIIKEDQVEKKIINKEGLEVFSGFFDEAKPLGSDYIVISRNGKKGMISGDAAVLLQPEYDAIGNYDQGYISILKNEKFGLLNQREAILIPAEYDKNLLRYTNHIFIAEKKGKRGFIDKENNALSPFAYDEIVYWNDSVAFVKQDLIWSLYNFNSQAVVDDGIRSMRIIVRNEDEMVAVILKKSGYGLISNTRGSIISSNYNDIVNVGTQDQPVYFTEKHISEAEYYVIIYYNANGKVIRRQALDASKYASIYCD